MRKILLILSLFVNSIVIYAQTYKYYTDSFSYKIYNGVSWSDWSKWQNSHILVVISIDRDIISIYSENIQEYDIYKYDGKESDGNGGNILIFSCVNRDGLRCRIRFRIQSDKSKQLYVDFSDIMWVYNLIER